MLCVRLLAILSSSPCIGSYRNLVWHKIAIFQLQQVITFKLMHKYTKTSIATSCLQKLLLWQCYTRVMLHFLYLWQMQIKLHTIVIIKPMLRRVIVQFLLLVSAMMLVVKPLIGFSLYHQAKTQGENEFITVIKAFSKRKQEYLDWVDAKDGVCLTLAPVRHFAGKIKEFFITRFFNRFVPNFGAFATTQFQSILLPLDRLYLRHLQLTL